MNFQRIVLPILGVALVVMAWRSYGWPGVALVGGGLLMFLLLHFSRLMHVLKRAAESPIGYVGSAVMLNARLKPGVTLLHVIAMTRALGEQLSPKDEQPEIFRWTDGTRSSVTGEFTHGKLVRWKLERPPQEDAAPAAAEAGGTDR